jgi:hypothetical protein
MNDDSNLQRLLQLKRYETPGDGFADDFLREFHQRQRAEWVKRSSWSLLWERFEMGWAQWVNPRWTPYAAAACLFVLASLTLTRQHEPQAINPAGIELASAADPVNSVNLLGRPSLEVNSPWLEEVQGSQKMDVEDLLLSRHFQGVEGIDSFSSGREESMARSAMPVSLELSPTAEPLR